MDCFIDNLYFYKSSLLKNETNNPSSIFLFNEGHGNKVYDCVAGLQGRLYKKVLWYER